MATRFLYGNWDQERNASGQAINVFADGISAVVPGKSPGLVRVSPITIGPSMMERWAVLGWSIRLALLADATNIDVYGRIGTLWGGLAIDSQQSNQGGLSGGGAGVFPGRAQFPPDLSTFDVLWTQSEDIALSSFDASQPPPASLVPTPVAKSFTFPVPIPVDPGTQMAMELVFTPGVYSAQTTIICASGSWSLVYDDDAQDGQR
jgi:hypothetical protein